jgi:putative heme-binding domain-containing protein
MADLGNRRSDTDSCIMASGMGLGVPNRELIFRELHKGMMAIRTTHTCFSGIVLFAAILTASLVHSQQPNSGTQPAVNVTENTGGRQTFAANCAACHGLDGLGTQRAPNIVTGSRGRQLSPADILRIVSDGIPGTGMPSFRSLGEDRLNAIVAYVTGLQGKNSAASVPGDPAKGRQLFFGAAGCSSCHMVKGHGGFMAPDLSDYAQTRSADRIQAAITDRAARDSTVSVVTAITAGGQQYRGIVRNEDNFSLQLQSQDGSFHFFSKAALKRIDREPASLMPSDYGTTLTPAQLDDLVSYLLSVSHASEPAPIKDKDED